MANESKETLLNEEMVLVTKELVAQNKSPSKDDFHELVHIALQSGKNIFYMLDNENLIAKIKQVPQNHWQGDILNHPDLPKIALAALYHGEISKDALEMMVFNHNATLSYGHEKVKIAKITDPLLKDRTVLQQYISRQMTFALQYREHHGNPISIAEIEEKIKHLDDEYKYAVCVDVTDSFYKALNIFWQIEFKTKIVFYELENGKKIFIFMHPILSGKIDEIFFGENRVKSSKRAGTFDTFVLWKFHQLDIRLSDFYLPGVERLMEAHGTSFNPVEALAHDEYHKSICNLIFYEFRKILYGVIVPDIYEAYEANLSLMKILGWGYYTIEKAYSFLVDSDFTSFRKITNSKFQAIQEVFWEEQLGFVDDAHDKTRFYVAGQIALSMATNPEWKRLLPEIDVNQFSFHGIFFNFKDLLNEMRFSHNTCKDLFFTGKFTQFNKRKYIILKAFIQYLDKNLHHFNKDQLNNTIKNLLLTANLSLSALKGFSELNLENTIKSTYESMPLLKNKQIQKIKTLLKDIKFELIIFENTLLKMHIHYNTFSKEILQILDREIIPDACQQKTEAELALKELTEFINNSSYSAQEKFLILREDILTAFHGLKKESSDENENHHSQNISFDGQSNFFKSPARLAKSLCDAVEKYEPIYKNIEEQQACTPKPFNVSSE